ncbi:MAG: hypothetical protein PHV39_05400 [Methanomicrobium sp.]|nr:hypothetical protein [Methanomicrobium sp.]
MTQRNNPNTTGKAGVNLLNGGCNFFKALYIRTETTPQHTAGKITRIAKNAPNRKITDKSMLKYQLQK